jgi:hypothetical protein
VDCLPLTQQPDRLIDSVILHRLLGGDVRVSQVGQGDRIEVVFDVAGQPAER